MNASKTRTSHDFTYCLKLWSTKTMELPLREMQNKCIDKFLKETQLFSSGRHDRSTFNYLNSLLRKRIKEGLHYDKEKIQGHKRLKRQTDSGTTTISRDKMRHEVRAPDYKMVWQRFANRTKRLANYTVSNNKNKTYLVMYCKRLKIPTWVVVSRGMAYSTMGKEGKKIHRKLKIEKHLKPVMNSGAPGA